MRTRQFEAFGLFLLAVSIGLPIFWHSHALDRAPMPEDALDAIAKSAMQPMKQCSHIGLDHESKRSNLVGGRLNVVVALVLNTTTASMSISEAQRLSKAAKDNIQSMVTCVNPISDIHVDHQVIFEADLEGINEVRKASDKLHPLQALQGSMEWSLIEDSTTVPILRVVLILTDSKGRQMLNTVSEMNGHKLASVDGWGTAVFVGDITPADDILETLVKSSMTEIRGHLGLGVQAYQPKACLLSDAEHLQISCHQLQARWFATKKHTAAFAAELAELDSIYGTSPLRAQVASIASSMASAVSTGDISESLTAITDAYSKASQLSHSDVLLSQQHFPDDHLIAVYVPFFLPVIFQIIVQLTKTCLYL